MFIYFGHPYADGRNLGFELFSQQKEKQKTLTFLVSLGDRTLSGVFDFYRAELSL